MDVAGATNTGWVSRRGKIAGKEWNYVVGRPHLDFVHQCKLLPSQCEIFKKALPDFCMMQATAQNFQPIMTDAKMSVRQVQVCDKVVEFHNKSVMDPQYGPFNYPLTRSEVTKHTLTQGLKEYKWTQPDTSQLPTQIIMGLVKESATSGNKTQNPFNFDLREATVQFDDQKFEIQTDFMTCKLVEAYKQLFRDKGLEAAGVDCSITFDEFQSGYTLLAFDLTLDHSHEDCTINLLHQGKLSIALKLGTVLPNLVYVISLCFFDNLIQLSADHLPICDYLMV